MRESSVGQSEGLAGEHLRAEFDLKLLTLRLRHASELALLERQSSQSIAEARDVAEDLSQQLGRLRTRTAWLEALRREGEAAQRSLAGDLARLRDEARDLADTRDRAVWQAVAQQELESQRRAEAEQHRAEAEQQLALLHQRHHHALQQGLGDARRWRAAIERARGLLRRRRATMRDRLAEALEARQFAEARWRESAAQLNDSESRLAAVCEALSQSEQRAGELEDRRARTLEALGQSNQSLEAHRRREAELNARLESIGQENRALELSLQQSQVQLESQRHLEQTALEAYRRQEAALNARLESIGQENEALELSLQQSQVQLESQRQLGQTAQEAHGRREAELNARLESIRQENQALELAQREAPRESRQQLEQMRLRADHYRAKLQREAAARRKAESALRSAATRDVGAPDLLRLQEHANLRERIGRLSAELNAAHRRAMQLRQQARERIDQLESQLTTSQPMIAPAAS